MSIEFKPGQTLRVTISKTITRAAARKTIERLFMKDKANYRPLELRARNFKELPKRRGGQIWTKRPNKLHLPLKKGDAANVLATAAAIKDLASVEDFVQIAPQ